MITRIDIDTGMIEEVARFVFVDRIDAPTYEAIAADEADARQTLREHGYDEEAEWDCVIKPWPSEVVRLFMRQESELECEGK